MSQLLDDLNLCRWLDVLQTYFVAVLVSLSDVGSLLEPFTLI